MQNPPNKSKITSLRQKESMSKRERVKSVQLVMTVVRTVPVDATRHGKKGRRWLAGAKVGCTVSFCVCEKIIELEDCPARKTSSVWRLNRLARSRG